MRKLIGWSWPGNVRELENTIERSVLLCTSEKIQAADIDLPDLSPKTEKSDSAYVPGMTISETCDKGVQQWTGAKYSNGYNFPLATGATNSNAFTGSIASPVLGTLIAGDGSKDVYNYWLDSTGPVGGRP